MFLYLVIFLRYFSLRVVYVEVAGGWGIATCSIAVCHIGILITPQCNRLMLWPVAIQSKTVHFVTRSSSQEKQI